MVVFANKEKMLCSLALLSVLYNLHSKRATYKNQKLYGLLTSLQYLYAWKGGQMMTTGNSDKTAWLTVCGILLFMTVTKSPKAISNLDWKNKMQEKKNVVSWDETIFKTLRG